MGGGYERPDRFARQARSEGYEARSVYKLEAIDQKTRLLRPGQKVVDLGCYPGSWSRYALQRVGRNGRLVGVDLSTPRVSGGIFLEASVYDVTPEALLEALGGPADGVLSDMAPATSGVPMRDHVIQIELARRALTIAEAILAPGGYFVAKVFDGEDAPAFAKEVKDRFATMKRHRPPAVRKVSREFFVVATGFAGR